MFPSSPLTTGTTREQPIVWTCAYRVSEGVGSTTFDFATSKSHDMCTGVNERDDAALFF